MCAANPPPAYGSSSKAAQTKPLTTVASTPAGVGAVGGEPAGGPPGSQTRPNLQSSAPFSQPYVASTRAYQSAYANDPNAANLDAAGRPMTFTFANNSPDYVNPQTGQTIARQPSTQVAVATAPVLPTSTGNPLLDDMNSRLAAAQGKSATPTFTVTPTDRAPPATGILPGEQNPTAAPAAATVPKAVETPAAIVPSATVVPRVMPGSTEWYAQNAGVAGPSASTTVKAPDQVQKLMERYLKPSAPTFAPGSAPPAVDAVTRALMRRYIPKLWE